MFLKNITEKVLTFKLGPFFFSVCLDGQRLPIQVKIGCIDDFEIYKIPDLYIVLGRIDQHLGAVAGKRAAHAHRRRGAWGAPKGARARLTPRWFSEQPNGTPRRKWPRCWPT